LSAAFHPDGNLFGVGTAKGSILIFNTKTSEAVATFESDSTPGPVTSISFSENGTFLAVANGGSNSSSATIWSLRTSEIEKTFEIGSPVHSLAWDYTGQFLAIAGSGGVSVQQYSKKEKSWTEPLKLGEPAKFIGWASQAKKLVVLNESGKVKILGAKEE
jgi:pre-mRNA-processing factor 19